MCESYIMIRIPALRSKIGVWIYYTSSLSFEEVDKYVKKIDKDLHTSEGLSDAIQRSITDNYKNIRDYILNQNERFFNSLVLAIYDGDPEWIEVELNFEDTEYFNMGFLKLSGDEKIFPVDGQHRVEGIKAAILLNPELKKEKVPVIFIGHQKNDDGMKKTRRLFSTLNRYAKPVSMSDIVALDEDDSAAIITRYLVENIPIFLHDKVVSSLQKAIPDTNKKCLTSLITLYECNSELVKFFFNESIKKTVDYQKTKFRNFLRFRPNDIILMKLQIFIEAYWSALQNSLVDISDFVHNQSDDPASSYRNKEGGNILFRPAGLLPFVQATLVESKKNHLDGPEPLEELDFEEIIGKFSEINFSLNSAPWEYVAWDPVNKTMKTSISKRLIKCFFLYFAETDNNSVLTPSDSEFIKKQYASSIGYVEKLEDINLEDLLKI